MLGRAALCIVVATAVCIPQAAVARSPLKRADMKTIRKDARAKGEMFARQYGAKDFTVTCRKRSPYSARCRVNLMDVRASTHDCAVTLVYVVTRAHSIAGDLARDGCA